VTAFVLDASLSLSWYFEDEISDEADRLLTRLEVETAAVPQIWPLEVANGFAMAERRGRVSKARTIECIAQLEALAIRIDDETAARAFNRVLELARDERLSTYDAAYLELALRLGVPLASKDGPLCDAAERVGVSVIRVA